MNEVPNTTVALTSPKYNVGPLSALVRKERLKQRFSLRELSLMTGLSHESIAHAEQGRSSIKALKTISEALSLDLAVVNKLAVQEAVARAKARYAA